MMTKAPNTFRKTVVEDVKIVPLGDEINRLQSRLGGLRRQTGRLTDSQPHVQPVLRPNGQV